jgi:membrane-associated phospholipid phosphatase
MILVPTIAFAVSDVSITYKLLIPFLYMIITIAPFLILREMGKISDYEFTKREERPLYFTITTIGYLLLFFLTALLLKNPILTHITLAIFVATCILTIVTLYWKMSGHMTYSTLLFFTLLYLFPYATALPLLFVFTPLIATSRVILKKHTIMQTIVGTLVSATVSILILWIL